MNDSALHSHPELIEYTGHPITGWRHVPVVDLERDLFAYATWPVAALLLCEAAHADRVAAHAIDDLLNAIPADPDAMPDSPLPAAAAQAVGAGRAIAARVDYPCPATAQSWAELAEHVPSSEAMKWLIDRAATAQRETTEALHRDQPEGVLIDGLLVRDDGVVTPYHP
jgi:hypothetical protein